MLFAVRRVVKENSQIAFIGIVCALNLMVFSRALFSMRKQPYATLVVQTDSYDRLSLEKHLEMAVSQ